MNLIAATRAEGGLVILMKDFHLTYKLNRKHSLTEHNGHDDNGDDGGPVNDDDEGVRQHSRRPSCTSWCFWRCY